MCSVFTFWLAFLVVSFVWLAFLVRCVSAVFVESPEIPGKLSVRASLFCSGVFPLALPRLVVWPQMCSHYVRSPTGCRFFVRFVFAVFVEFRQIPGKVSVRASLFCSGVFPLALPRLVFWPHSVRHCFPHFPPDFRSVFGLCPPLASWLGPLAFCPVFSD